MCSGGAIAAAGNVSLYLTGGSSINGCEALLGFGGVVFAGAAAAVFVREGSSVAGNSAQSRGGGAVAAQGLTLSIM